MNHQKRIKNQTHSQKKVSEALTFESQQTKWLFRELDNYTRDDTDSPTDVTLTAMVMWDGVDLKQWLQLVANQLVKSGDISPSEAAGFVSSYANALKPNRRHTGYTYSDESTVEFIQQ